MTQGKKVILNRDIKYPNGMMDFSKSSISVMFLLVAPMEPYFHLMYATKLPTYMRHGQLVDHQGPHIIDQRPCGSRCIRLKIGLRPLCYHTTHGLKEKKY